MRKIIAILLATGMCLSLAGCGSADAEELIEEYEEEISELKEQIKEQKKELEEKDRIIRDYEDMIYGPGEVPDAGESRVPVGEAEDVIDEDQSSTADSQGAIDVSEEREKELNQLLCEDVWYGRCHGTGRIEEFVYYEDGHYEIDGDGSDSYTWEFRGYMKDATGFFNGMMFQTTPPFALEKGLYVTDEFYLGYDADGNPVIYMMYDYLCYQQPDYGTEKVEITTDNWQEYFELREFNSFLFNGFGEFDRAGREYYLLSKKDLDLDLGLCDVTVEYTYTYDYKYYTIDADKETILHGEILKTQTSDPAIYTMHNNYIQEENADYYGITVLRDTLDGPKGGMYVVTDINMIRVTGNLYLKKAQ